MATLPLGTAQPFAISLAADPRLSPTDYADDGIWELVADPLPGLRSSFGGRCPTITLAWQCAANADTPVATTLYSSYVNIETVLDGTVAVSLSYWTPSSHHLLARMVLCNTGTRPWLGTVRAALERTGHDAQPLAELLQGGEALLLAPDLWMQAAWRVNPADAPSATGAAHGQVSLAPRAEYSLELQLSYGRVLPPLLPQAHGATWDSGMWNLARLHALNADIPEIRTGNADWDAASACTYALSTRCYVGPTASLPHPSFVFTRSHERGWSAAGDGSDHSWQWNGQVATEAYVSCPIVAASDPALALGVLHNYLAIQAPSGAIDWKPGLAGQREGIACMPLLAAIARIVYEYSGDGDAIIPLWPGMLRHLRHWFTPAHDRDGDGLPEWTNSIHNAFDDCPSFVPWQRWGQGLSITQAEAPDMASYLFRECCDLLFLADELALDVPSADRLWLAETANRLRAAADSLWCHERGLYRYRDRDSHRCPPGVAIWYGTADALPTTLHALPPGGEAGRLVVRLAGPPVDRLRVLLRGRGAAGQQLEEALEREAFGFWSTDARLVVSASSEHLFASLDSVAIAGLGAGHEAWLAWADFMREDQTLLLPLWAGLPGAERAAALVATLGDERRFWRPFGIPNCSAEDPAYASNNRGGSGGTWMMWNTMLGEGLCRYGYYAEAWELFGRITAAIVGRLREEHAFREAYDNDSGAGIGARDYLWGVVPLHLFTLLIGVQIQGPAAVRLWPTDLGGRSIVVRRHGVKVLREGQFAQITWPDGSTQEVPLPPEQRPPVVRR